MLLEVGKIDKPHGVRGEVVVSLSTNRDERVAPGTVLSLKDGSTLTVASSKPFQHRWIVRFDEITTREGADMLHGAPLFAEPLDDPEALWVHELIASVVVDVATGDEIGRVTSVEENPASDLLVLDTGHLIPLRFVVSHDQGRVTVDLPAGLLEL
ncbi:MAG TPA: ribosome maturation factor RimM [Acidimicrobiales bacterium]|nr:ribosome maturation factor RimM [Acidimicrobiales bacterium]